MHSCLTLVDYTWKDSEESGRSSPKYTNNNNDHIYRLRRTSKSLDGDTTMNSSLNQNNNNNTIQLSGTNRHLNDRINHSFIQMTNRNSTHHHHHHHHHSSMLLLNNRRLPIYATTKQLLKRPDRIWVPVGHCRYLLERDLHTGEIQWNPEGNEIICTPRSLAEICMARLIRDWPCMLPTRRSSLRNIVSYLFSSRDLQSNPTQNFPTSSTTSTETSTSGPRRSASVSSREPRCKTDRCKSKNRKLKQKHSLNNNHDDDDDDYAGDNNNKDIHKTNNHCTNTPPLTCHDLPVTVLINLLSEAILQRDCSAITGIIANWPCEQLIIKQLIPNEEYPLSLNYMTKPTFVLVSPENEYGNRNTLVKGPSLLDGFILGFLTRQSGCKLKSVDFTGFEEDCRVSIELSRLPILWMKPENRNSESVRRHLMASLHIGIPRKRLEAYFSRISTIYAFHEADIGHGKQFDTVTIHLDCNMTVDEVALGLSLQTLTPFRFSCNRLLLQRLPEINFPPYSLIRLFDPLSITQFELEDPTIGSSIAVVLPSAVGWLISLRNLRACSLPSCIPPPPDVVPNTPTPPTLPPTIVVSNTGGLQSNSSQQSNTVSLSSSSGSSSSSSSSSTSNTNNASGANSSNINNTSTSSSMSSTTTTNNTLQNSTTPAFTSTVAACRLLNRALVSLRYLQRLGLARCHLTGQLKTLLGGLSQPLEYLNLQDCCLSSEDIHYLVHQWRPLHGLYELNLSRNNLSVVPKETLYELVQNVCLKPRGRLVCLSIAYTCLSIERLINLLSLMAGMDPSHSLNENNEEDNIDTNYMDKWIDNICTLRVLCIQSFIPPTQLQIHRILYRIIRLPKLHKLHIFPAFYAFPGDTEIQQREQRYNQLIHSRNYLKQKCRSDIELL